MPKLDLSSAARIKGAGGEIVGLKGVGFAWSKPFALASFYEGGLYPGGLYQPYDLSNAFTDVAGTINATQVDDPCRYLADTSGNGNHFLQPQIDAAPRVKLNSAGKYVVETDGVDNVMTCGSVDFSGVSAITIAIGVNAKNTNISGQSKHALLAHDDGTATGGWGTNAPNVGEHWRSFLRADGGASTAYTTDPQYAPPQSRVFLSRITLTDQTIWLDNAADGAEVGYSTHTLSSFLPDGTLRLGHILGSIQHAKAEFSTIMAIGRDLTEAQRLDVAARIASDMGHTI